MAWLSKLYADDSIMITFTGEIRTKADQLKDIGSGIVGHQKTEENYLKFRFYKIAQSYILKLRRS